MSDAAAEEVAGLVMRLQSNLLFSLSLGSKELFHTNLLAWVAEHRHDVADTLLQLWSGEPAADTTVRAQREWNHLDLVLSDVLRHGHERVRVVVENKMFALPDLAQLERYSTVVRRLGGSPALILLSLADPGWPDGSWTDGTGLRWQHCSYRTLAEAIDRKPLGQNYVGDTLRHWQSMLLALHRLTELVGQPRGDEPFTIDARLKPTLTNARLYGPMQKLRAHHLASLLRDRLSDVEDVAIAANLTNATGLVEAFVDVAENVEAGWQLQGRDWRMAVRVKPGHQLYGRRVDQVAGRARLAAQSGWATFDLPLFTRPPFAGLRPRPVAADGTAGFGRFSPDFAYRYVKLNDITLHEAADAGAAIIRYATSLRGQRRWRV